MRAATPASRRRRAPGEPAVARLGRCSWSGRRSLLKVLDRCTHFGRVPTPATRRARASRTRRPAGREPPPPPPLDANRIGRTTPGTSWWFRPTAARRPDRPRCRGLHSASIPRCRAPCPRSAPSDQSAFRAGRFSARNSCRTSPIRDSDACSASRPAIRMRSLATINRRAVRSRVTSSAAARGFRWPHCSILHPRARRGRRAPHRPSYRSGSRTTTCRPAWYVYLPVDPLQITPRAGQTGRPGGHRGHCDQEQRTAIDQLRVALSRATKTLAFVDVAGDEDAHALSADLLEDAALYHADDLVEHLDAVDRDDRWGSRACDLALNLLLIAGWRVVDLLPGCDRLGGSTNATASPICGWPRSARPPSASCPRSWLHSTAACCRAPHLTSRPGTDRRSEAQRQTAPRARGRTRLDTVPEAGPAPRLREPHRPRRRPARRREAAEEDARALAAPSLDPASDSTRPTSAAEGDRSDAEYREAERHHRSA